MISQRQLFLQHVGQTSESPVMLEIEKAEGIYLYDIYGKKYIDLISGVSVSNVGHCHPKVTQAVKNQVDKYMHLMVYGEYIQSPQVQFAQLLAKQIPESLSSTYFVNSGSEANEAALKLAKRYTGRTQIIACKNAYHGSTHGALSLMSQPLYKEAFLPLLPEVEFIEFNNDADLNFISEKTACVIVEPVQAEAGIILPENNYLQKLRKKCTETNTLLIFDEVQTGFGRLGSLFGFIKYNVIPDIFTIAKGMGGGMPIGAVVSSKKIMDAFKTNPVLGHITTFGGHPVSAAAALASLNILIDEHIIAQVDRKGELFRKLLTHKLIKKIHGTGLLLSVEISDFDMVLKFNKILIEKGAISDWFLFCNNRFRIAPPLIITESQIADACKIIISALDEISK